MSFLLRNRGARFAIGMGLCVAGALAAPAACLFPDYSFDEPELTGGPTSGGGSNTSSSGGGTSTGTNPENCANGVDDDNDGAMDCADVKCTDHACVPEVPTGWTGYFALYDGAPAGDPGCPAAFPSTTNPSYLGNSGITVPPAACTCSCGAAQGQVCAALNTITLSTLDAQCNGNPNCVGQATNLPATANTCENNPYYPGGQLTCGPNTSPTCDTQTGDACNVAVSATALEASGGNCAPNPVAVVLPDVQWAKLGHACGDSGALGEGCNIGQACLPKPPMEFETGVCISQEGDIGCPAGAFTEKHVFFGEVTDTRACTDDCSCGAPSGGTCPTTISLYSDLVQNTCNNLIAQFPAGGCMNLNGNPNVAGRKASAPGAPTGATCTTSGGAATGTATPASPRTFCCIP